MSLYRMGSTYRMGCTEQDVHTYGQGLCYLPPLKMGEVLYGSVQIIHVFLKLSQRMKKNPTYMMTCASSKHSYQPGHVLIMMRDFVVWIKNPRVPSYPLSKELRL